MAPQSALTGAQLIVIELFDGLLVGAHVFRDLGLPVQRVYFSTCDGLVELVNHTIFPDAENIGFIEQLNVNLLNDTNIIRIWEIRMVNQFNQPITRAEIDPLYWKA